MAPRALLCPHCGATLPPEARTRLVVCVYCKASVTCDEDFVSAAAFKRALSALDAPDTLETPALGPTLEKVWVAGLPYRLIGRLARGESTDVHLATRARRITERVIIKLLRAPGDADLLDREWAVIAALQKSEAQGASRFTQRIPEPVSRGILARAGNETPALIYRYKSGFHHSLTQVSTAYPGGVEAHHGVWIWRRLLELLGWVHRSGFAHGAVLPQHVILHARDHGADLVGFSCAVRLAGDERLPAVSAAQHAYYPPELIEGARPSAASDIAMSARVVIGVLGGNPATGALPAAIPDSVATILHAYAALDRSLTRDAWTLREEVGRAAHRAFGPPRYHPFTMPE